MGVIAASAPMPGFLESMSSPLEHYGYWAIALLLLLENIGIPVVPGELALIAGAIFAGNGQAGLNVVGVGIVAVVAAVAGAEIGYLIGKFAGRELILHHGKYVLIKPHHLERAEATVARYGGIVVVVARFIVVLRELNGIVAGITRMRWTTFAFFNVIGACAWVATWLTIGYVAGDHIETIYSGINRFALYVLVALAVLLAGYIGWRLLRRRRRAARAVSEPAKSNDATETAEAPGSGDGQVSAEAESGDVQGSGEAQRTGDSQGPGDGQEPGARQGPGDETGLPGSPALKMPQRQTRETEPE
jgi:membrane protein DedA with SNARE-associated domain